MLDLAIEAAPAAEHDRDQHQADHQMPVLGETRHLMFQEDQETGTHDGADQGAEAAEDHHDQQLAGQGPVQQARRDEHRVLRGQGACQAGQGAGDRESCGLVAPDGQAQGAHAQLIGPDADKGTPEAGPQQGSCEQVGDRGQRHAEEREVEGIVEIDPQAGEVEAGYARQAVVAPERPAFEDVGIAHLTEGEGRHDEEDAVGARRYGADHPGEETGGEDGQRQTDRRIPAQQDRGRGEGIGADPEERAVAEGDHAAVAGDQV